MRISATLLLTAILSILLSLAVAILVRSLDLSFAEQDGSQSRYTAQTYQPIAATYGTLNGNGRVERPNGILSAK